MLRTNGVRALLECLVMVDFARAAYLCFYPLLFVYS
jgi:hypothetical protein